jgi:DNA repair protein RecN (Recombination protein N)
VANHRRLLDAFGSLEGEVAEVGRLWQAFHDAEGALSSHRELMEKAEAEREFIAHAIEELRTLDPKPLEETRLSEARQLMMNAEQFAGALGEAEDAISGEHDVGARVSTALRKLERRKDSAGGRLDDVCTALDRLLSELVEARASVAAARRSFEFDPRELEKSEERLFSLRAAARKYRCQVDDLSSVLARFEHELQAINDGGSELGRLQKLRDGARASFFAAARGLSEKRKETALKLNKAVAAELPPLKLERARFETEIDSDETRAGPHGIDRVEFLVSTNPGAALSPLMKVASGGELARFMLALKVVLASNGSAPTLIFDEIDTGVGGAVAEAIGTRLARLAKGLQVLAVTHSPQVAARAGRHFLISKMEEVGSERMVTRVQELSSSSRREEIARMLSGARVTDEARAQAGRLLEETG